MGTIPANIKNLASRLHLRRGRKRQDLESRVENAAKDIPPDDKYDYMVRRMGIPAEEVVYGTGAHGKDSGLPCREITDFQNIADEKTSYRINKNAGNSLLDMVLFGMELGSTAFLRTGFSPILLYDGLLAGYCLRTSAKNYIPEHIIDKIAPYFFIIGSVAAPAIYYFGMRMTNTKLENWDFAYMGAEFLLSMGKVAVDYLRKSVERDIKKATYRQEMTIMSSLNEKLKSG